MNNFVFENMKILVFGQIQLPNRLVENIPDFDNASPKLKLSVREPHI